MRGIKNLRYVSFPHVVANGIRIRRTEIQCRQVLAVLEGILHHMQPRIRQDDTTQPVVVIERLKSNFRNFVAHSAIRNNGWNFHTGVHVCRAFHRNLSAAPRLTPKIPHTEIGNDIISLPRSSQTVISKIYPPEKRKNTINRQATCIRRRTERIAERMVSTSSYRFTAGARHRAMTLR